MQTLTPWKRITPLNLTPVGELRLGGKKGHVAAASGLVKVDDTFHVVADDSLDLSTFSTDLAEGGVEKRLLDRQELPQDEKQRKAFKPDLESLTQVSTQTGEALLALGSGSTESRHTGVYLGLDSDGQTGKPIAFDLSPLYHSLGQQFPQLNIEGAAALDGKLRLLQRGNGEDSSNAIIDLDLHDSIEAASQGKALTPDLIRGTKSVDLGSTTGSQGEVPWTFTDLTSLGDGRSLFIAAAEDTDNPYDDGEILGSAVGVMEADGTISQLRPTVQNVKLEGLAVETTDEGLQAYLVTDGDDPHRPATMYKVGLEL